MNQPANTALVELIDRHLDDVYGYIAFRLAPDTEGVEDIVQEVFAAATRGWSTLARQASAKAWLLQIARNKVADHFRMHARQSAQRLSLAQIDETSN